MNVLKELKPRNVFGFFEEICKIPHGSGNTKIISDYLAEFAKQRNLKYYQDENNNVVIYKDAAAGYENAPVVILQGHTDMVAEKTPGSAHDFEKNGLKLKVDGDDLTAEDTTLGGDDGIAVAYMMAVLDDLTLKHPALECVFTSDEEIGLIGAGALDCSVLKGKYLLNLDSEEEGYLWVSCAGGLSGTSELPVEYQEIQGEVAEIVVDGLIGGHSGAEIDKIRANANKLMGRLLMELGQQMPFSIVELAGGTKDNAITRQCKAVLVMETEDLPVLQEYVDIFVKNIRKEYAGTDDGITIKVTAKGNERVQALSMLSKEKVVFYLVHVPYGVYKMSGEIKDLVETSSNLGILKLEKNALVAVNSVRSSVKSGKEDLSRKIMYLTEFLGGEYHIQGDYPAWEYKKESPLRDLMVEVYEKMFEQKPYVKAIHAGLECGLFYDKIDGLDCVSFGPTMKDIHTTEEKLSISSTARMWKYLVQVLENIH